MDAFFTAIGNGFEALLGWIGIFLNNLLVAPAEGEKTMYVVMPLIGLLVAFGIVKFGMRFVYRFIPGL